MNELARDTASDLLKKEPNLVKIFDEFLAVQEEFTRLLDLMGFRHVAVELPPAGNAEGPLHGNVSGSNR